MKRLPICHRCYSDLCSGVSELHSSNPGRAILLLRSLGRRSRLSTKRCELCNQLKNLKTVS